MSTARFMDRIAAAPISWGICEAPGWGPQLPVDRVLAEARDLGIRSMEQGALGWLPVDPAKQRDKLAAFGVELLGGFVPLVLHDATCRDASLRDADRIATSMAAAGGTFFITAPVPSLDDWHRPDLDDAQWAELLANLDRVDTICARVGLIQAVHPHVDTLIETAADLDRFLAGCSAKLCFDTGHLTIGGADVRAFAADHLDRIAVVHLKDVNMAVAARERSGELDLMAATFAGLFPSLGDGDLPLGEIIDILESGGYTGWYVMETDVALTDGLPADGEGPVRGVERSLSFLRSVDPDSVTAPGR